MLTRFLFITSFCMPAMAAVAQNTTSPYSILGIGDIETKDYGKFFGMASTSLAMHSATYINLNNPASLTSLDPNMLNIDINGRYRSSSFRYTGIDSATSSYSDAAVRRMSLTFNPGENYGISFGLKPYSTVNYLLEQNLSLAGSSTKLTKIVDGSGGVNQVYLANAVKLSKNFSVGLTASYLFGSLKRSTQYVYEDLGVNITRNEYDEMRAFQFQLGVQYSGKISDRLTQQFGAVVSNPVSMTRNINTDYVDSDSTISSSADNGKKFRLPLQFGVGYAITIDDRTTIAADYKFYNWENQKLEYPNAYTDKAQRFSLGIQHITLTRTGGKAREKLFFQAGLAYEKGYIKIDRKSIDELSASVGIGSNVTRLINCYVGFEFGKKGSISDNQIQENFTQLSLGITLKELWYNTKKLKRFD